RTEEDIFGRPFDSAAATLSPRGAAEKPFALGPAATDRGRKKVPPWRRGKPRRPFTNDAGARRGGYGSRNVRSRRGTGLLPDSAKIADALHLGRRKWRFKGTKITLS